ncbi:MAG: hypothetical protein EOM68_15205 [Spirochaetia bacterium]|nr:hypothetical protein [Spirochaetia bacterium]
MEKEVLEALGIPKYWYYECCVYQALFRIDEISGKVAHWSESMNRWIEWEKKHKGTYDRTVWREHTERFRRLYE